MEKQWKIKTQPDKKFKNQFKKYSPFIQTILFLRGIKTPKEAEAFFNLDYGADQPDLNELSGIKPAVKRIRQALKDKEKLAVYGDYDADGVTASSILFQFFKELGVTPVVYIPDRVKEGYGLNKEAAEYLKKKGVQLVITVDTGVRNVTEVAEFKRQGMEVIITDHHVAPDKLPRALAIVNPHKKGERYAFKELSGAGVTFKLVQALIRDIGEDKFSAGFEKWLLDLVAVGTIADLVPLKGENRLLTKYGLIVLAKTRRLGLKYLMDSAGLNYEREPVTATQVAFQIAPRINAAGRMDHANSAFVLLNEDDSATAKRLAESLEKQNRKRQDLTQKIFKKIEKIDFKKDKLIIAGDKSWPLGVLGLVSGRLTDKYCRPSLVYTDEGDRLRGSARSTPVFNMIKALETVKDLLPEYGGHKQAAGFTLLKKDLPEFEKRLKKLAGEQLKEKDLIPELSIDYETSFEELGYEMLEELKALEPLGAQNAEPVFLLKNTEIKTMRFVGKTEKHLKMTINGHAASNGKQIGVIAFNWADKLNGIKIGDRVDIVFNLVANYFNGKEYLELRLIDWKAC